jgi:hypothetical protein
MQVLNTCVSLGHQLQASASFRTPQSRPRYHAGYSWWGGAIAQPKPRDLSSRRHPLISSVLDCTTQPVAWQLQWDSPSNLVHCISLLLTLALAVFLANMVVFVDLEEDAEPPELKIAQGHWPRTVPVIDNRAISGHGRTLDGREDQMLERLNPNRNALTEAMGCYP